MLIITMVLMRSAWFNCCFIVLIVWSVAPVQPLLSGFLKKIRRCPTGLIQLNPCQRHVYQELMISSSYPPVLGKITYLSHFMVQIPMFGKIPEFLHHLPIGACNALTAFVTSPDIPVDVGFPVQNGHVLGLHSSFSDTKTVSDWLYIPWIYIYIHTLHTYIYM